MAPTGPACRPRLGATPKSPLPRRLAVSGSGGSGDSDSDYAAHISRIRRRNAKLAITRRGAERRPASAAGYVSVRTSSIVSGGPSDDSATTAMDTARRRRRLEPDPFYVGRPTIPCRHCLAERSRGPEPCPKCGRRPPPELVSAPCL